MTEKRSISIFWRDFDSTLRINFGTNWYNINPPGIDACGGRIFFKRLVPGCCFKRLVPGCCFKRLVPGCCFKRLLVFPGCCFKRLALGWCLKRLVPDWVFSLPKCNNDTSIKRGKELKKWWLDETMMSILLVKEPPIHHAQFFIYQEISRLKKIKSTFDSTLTYRPALKVKVALPHFKALHGNASNMAKSYMDMYINWQTYTLIHVYGIPLASTCKL